MSLKDLGYSESLQQYWEEELTTDFEPARVILEHKERYIVKTAEAEYEAELIGNLRFTAESRLDLPAVGDWVAIAPYDDGKALIHKVLPRTAMILRKAVAKTGQVQLIAANVDYGIIVLAADRDFNLNRLERYLTICHASKIIPIILLSKTDLLSASELTLLLSRLRERVAEVTLLTANNSAGGYKELIAAIERGKTYCLLGSSGVGKSTLTNALSGTALMQTGAISSKVGKGKHITSHRELVVLDNGGILIDNPGMREVGITDRVRGLETTFESILSYAQACRFSDCTHQHETACAVLEALENGDIDKAAYENFQKMLKEKAHFEIDALARKKKEKTFGKMIKDVVKKRRKDKF